MTDSERVLSKEACEAIARRVFNFTQGGGETRVAIMGWWQGEVRWARNRVSLASDRRDILVTIVRETESGGVARVTTNQSDDVSLEAAVRSVERRAELSEDGDHPLLTAPPLPRYERPAPAIWSEATYGLTAEARGELVRTLVAPAEAKGLLSAGYLEMRAAAQMEVSSERPAGPWGPEDTPYVQWTQAQCSTTVRDPSGTASGWAGGSSYDWGAIDAVALGARAMEKCLASRNPVTLEPGRYTVILEPQAVADIVEVIVGQMDRPLQAEHGLGPWALAYDEVLQLWRTKLGLKVIDERITISHDPMDPALGIVPRPWMQPVTWFDKGVLTNLEYDRPYALQHLNANAGVRRMFGYRMSGGTTSIDEMIATTRRGLLVTRFWNVRLLDGKSLLSTGFTRDGLWLIENGRITKAVKNFRFTESPLFVLNSVEQLGVPAPVFRPVKDPYEFLAPLTPAIVPPIKARDFSFTSTIDAI